MKKLIRVLSLSAILTFCLLLSSQTGSAVTPLTKITPGTSAQVSIAVKNSVLINKIPANLTPSLSEVSNDSFINKYPIMKDGCIGVNQCVFGDKTSKKIIAVLGDSHAAMWTAALIPFASEYHYRLVMLISYGCPAADISVNGIGSNYTDTQCNNRRNTDFGLINDIKPKFILLADSTAGYISSSTGTFPTNAQWQSAMETTIKTLTPSKAKVAIIGDINVMVIKNNPPDCLSAYPNNVQSCMQYLPEKSPGAVGHQNAEQAAAKVTGATYINTQSWICTSTTCSPIISRYEVYLDTNHLTDTYAYYLSGVLGHKLKLFTS